MKEQQIKKILEASKPKTKADFTDQLMDRIAIEADKTQSQTLSFPWPTLWAACILVGIGILLLALTDARIRIPFLDAAVSTRALLGVLSFAILWMINQIFVLRQQLPS